MISRLYLTTILITGLAVTSWGQTTQPSEAATTKPAAPPTEPVKIEVRPILSKEAKRAEAIKRIDRFVEHVQQSDAFADSAKTAVAQGWTKFRVDEHPEDFLLAGVSILSEPFKDGADALMDEDYEKADELLASQMDHADPYVSLHAQALAARSLVEQDRLEEAQQILKPLAGSEQALHERTFMEAEVDFLLGYCQLANLAYDDAVETLLAFDRQHPGAPERFRLPARQMLREALLRQPGGLGDVSDLMVYAGRRLSIGQYGEPVQIRQKQAVELLTLLIKKAEQQEQQNQNGCKDCGGKGCKKCQGNGSGDPKGNQRPSSPANSSKIVPGAGRIGNLERMSTARPGEVWGQMRPEEREQIMQALRQGFPAQYRQLVEQYYKQLAKEEQ